MSFTSDAKISKSTRETDRMGEAAEFLEARKGALSGICATIKILKHSVEAAQEITPSLEADLISIQKQEQSRGRGM